MEKNKVLLYASVARITKALATIDTCFGVQIWLLHWLMIPSAVFGFVVTAYAMARARGFPGKWDWNDEEEEEAKVQV